MDRINMGMGRYDDSDLNEAETAFLDEVPSPAPTSGTATKPPGSKAGPVSPLQTINATTSAEAAAARRKRKLDAPGDLEGALEAASVSDTRTMDEAHPPKVKRRKD